MYLAFCWRLKKLFLSFLFLCCASFTLMLHILCAHTHILLLLRKKYNKFKSTLSVSFCLRALSFFYLSNFRLLSIVCCHSHFLSHNNMCVHTWSVHCVRCVCWVNTMHNFKIFQWYENYSMCVCACVCVHDFAHEHTSALADPIYELLFILYIFIMLIHTNCIINCRKLRISLYYICAAYTNVYACLLETKSKWQRAIDKLRQSHRVWGKGGTR